MDFVDATLIQLANPATRAAVFDDDALEQMLDASFDLSSQPVTGPYAAQFDEFQVGYNIPSNLIVEGMWGEIGSGKQTRVNLQIDGLPGGQLRTDALWRGAIIARTITEFTTIAEVKTSRLVGDIDAEIIQALGALPADPNALEAARRNRLKIKLQALLGQPGLIDDGRFDAWLGRLGLASAGELLGALRTDLAAEGVTVKFSPPLQAAQPSPKSMPITAVLLVRNMPVSIGELLAESKQVRSRLVSAGLDAPNPPGFKRRTPVTVVWVVPAAWFDDAGWPGAAAGATPAQARAARRNAAGQWLAAEGIGLAAR